MQKFQLNTQHTSFLFQYRKQPEEVNKGGVENDACQQTKKSPESLFDYTQHD